MLLLGVCAHTDTHQLLLVRSVSLRKPLPPSHSPLPVALLQIKKGRVQKLLQRRGIKVPCACSPTAANGNVTLQTRSDPQRAANTCWPGGSVSSCKVTGLVTGDSQFSYVSVQPGGKAEPRFLTSACQKCHNIHLTALLRSATGLGHSRKCGQGGRWQGRAGEGHRKETSGLADMVGALAAPAGAQSRRPARQGGVLSDELTYMDGVGQPSLGNPWHSSRAALCLAFLIPLYSSRHLFC